MLWQIRISKHAVIFLEAMKDLAFFAFLKAFALETLESFRCEDPVNSTSSNGAKGCIFEGAPVMVLQAVCLGVVLLVFVLLYVIGKISTKLKTCYSWVKKIIIWNGFIRYAFHSTLKLQVTAATVIMI